MAMCSLPAQGGSCPPSQRDNEQRDNEHGAGHSHLHGVAYCNSELGCAPRAQQCPVSSPRVQQSSQALAGQCQLGRGLQEQRGSGSSPSQPQLSAEGFPEGKSPTPHVPSHSQHCPDFLPFTKARLGYPTCKHSASSSASPRVLRGEQPPGDPTPRFPGFPRGHIKAGDMLLACSFPTGRGFPRHSVSGRVPGSRAGTRREAAPAQREPNTLLGRDRTEVLQAALGFRSS